MNSKSKIKAIAIACLCWFSVLIPCVILVATGTVTLSVSNFAVDSNDRVYIGTEREIAIYQNNMVVGSIVPPTSRGYAFTVTEDDNILLSTASNVYLLDLEGNVLRKVPEIGTTTFNELQRNKREFISVNGDFYQMQGNLLRTRIIKNNSENVFQISVLSVVVKYLLIFSAIGMYIFIVLWLITRIKRQDGFLS